MSLKMHQKKIVFLTGTRADYGKLKAIMQGVSEQAFMFESSIFITGMHMLTKYGSTFEEVLQGGHGKYYTFINQNNYDTMDSVLSKSIAGFSDFVKEIKPDMIIVHGDRVEALAGALVGSLNNILVSHIEGGELSGTIDESLRHAISKLSHIHFVANHQAKKRLIQLGELANTVHIVGSPDIDMMVSKNLPTLDEVKIKYEIEAEKYAILMFHPVTTDVKKVSEYTKNMLTALKQSEEQYIVIYPNNDLGSAYIFEEYEKLQLEGNANFTFFPSMRFECFLTLIKHAHFIIGNSSAGVREAPFYGLPSINIGARQKNRSSAKTIIHCEYSAESILSAIDNVKHIDRSITHFEFGEGESKRKMLSILSKDEIWDISPQKYFVDLEQEKFQSKELEEQHEDYCTS